MLTKEDDVEIHAYAARGWTKAAIARHTGRDRKTVAKYLARPAARRRERAPSCLEPFRSYLEASGVRPVLSDAGPRAAPVGAAAGVPGLPAPPRPGADR